MASRLEDRRSGGVNGEGESPKQVSGPRLQLTHTLPWLNTHVGY